MIYVSKALSTKVSINHCNRIFVFIEPEGCKEVVKLEHLQGHVTTCEYSNVTCDKGCNLQMIRREYRANNCFTHFNEHVRKHKNQLSPKMRIVLRNQIAYNECLIKGQQEENRKLVAENIKLKEQLHKRGVLHSMLPLHSVPPPPPLPNTRLTPPTPPTRKPPTRPPNLFVKK